MTPIARFWSVAGAVLLLDQATKGLVHVFLLPGDAVPVLGDFARIVFVWNTGAAFGLFREHPSFFTILTAVAVAAISFWRLHAPRNEPHFPLALVLGGAAGNLVDRIVRGRVVDFADVGLGALRWPAFNVADAAITVGVLWLLVMPARERHPT